MAKGLQRNGNLDRRGIINVELRFDNMQREIIIGGEPERAPNTQGAGSGFICVYIYIYTYIYIYVCLWVIISVSKELKHQSMCVRRHT